MNDMGSRVSAPRPAARSRPGAVIAVIVLSLLRAILTIFVWLPLLQYTDAATSSSLDAGIKTLYTTLLFGLPILAIAEVAVAVGLWMLKNWGRIGAIVVFGLDIVLGFVFITLGTGFSPGQIVGFAVDVIVIVMLLQPNVVSAFEE